MQWTKNCIDKLLAKNCKVRLKRATKLIMSHVLAANLKGPPNQYTLRAELLLVINTTTNHNIYVKSYLFIHLL